MPRRRGCDAGETMGKNIKARIPGTSRRHHLEDSGTRCAEDIDGPIAAPPPLPCDVSFAYQFSDRNQPNVRSQLLDLFLRARKCPSVCNSAFLTFLLSSEKSTSRNRLRRLHVRRRARDLSTQGRLLA